MSLSPNSSIVRRTIDLNYANKQRSDAVKWIFINGTLLLFFLYDLLTACPERSCGGAAVRAGEAAAAAALGAALLRHALRLAPRRAAPLALSRAQQRLLGLRDEDLDSSFRIEESPPAARRAREGAPHEEPAPAPAPLSPPRSWRGAGGAARSPPPSPPSPPSPPPVRDEFIADRGALDAYLRQAEAEETAGGAASGDAGGWAPYSLVGGGGGGGGAHQLAVAEDGGGAAGAGEAAAAPGAPLCRRLHLDPHNLAQYTLNLRRWLHATIFQRVVREMEECDAALAAAGHEARVGGAAAARLAALAGAAPAGAALARRLRALLPFLRPFADQRYAAARVRELARSPCLAAYRWDGGGADWDAARPADADLVADLFAAYMDSVLPGGGGGGGGLVSAAPAPPRRAPGALALHRAARHPPHYLLVLGEEALEVSRGRHNLLHSLLLLVAAVARRDPPALRRLHLGPAGLNMLWILGR